MMEWIKVKDKVPRKSGRYLVFEEKDDHMHNCAAYNYPYPCCEINIAYYCAFDNSWVWSSFEPSACSPTHWFYLPELPREE